ncbi:actin-related protein 10 [Megachile rotundata]|uniref:actin-related protein 10 n=1 Tax=Megachile rotundata TaxID=143995 RepID=UPI000258D946|nr:PREDICTED: actin-related protein 10 [Megachile rotundata]XP_012154506.1 PREDICTED: actin-related protein 10 [Megachile rotundata]XP_012154507.1 PREDICTED: actin-related protein 10 [Megachile rotundata]
MLRFLSDKQMVIFDIGSAYTKFGYAGEVTPRGIIRTEIKCSETKELRKIYDYKDAEDLYQLLVDFLHALFFRHVVICPKDARIVVLESPLCTTLFRDTLAKVLFRHFEIGSLMLLPIHLATISTLGVNTALVLDVGYKEATLIPIFEGVSILKAWQALPLGSQIVHENLIKSLKEVSPNVDISEKLVEDIKVRTCFVTTLERSNKLGTPEAPNPPPAVKYPGIKSINIPGEVREKAYEALWERDNDNLSIPTMILDALLQCPIDTRRVLAENILLIGGTTMAKGFMGRLKSELSVLIKSNLYSEKLKIRTFKFHTAPSKPNYTAWLGGAIFGTIDLPLRCLTKENYLKSNRVPDWASLVDNQKEDSLICEI